jgi:hypothetical protein
MRIGKRNFASRKRKTAGLFAFVLAGVIGVGAYAFTAKAEVKERSVGAGTAAVTGYAVEGNEQYSFNEAGTEMTAVKFVLGGKEIPTDVKIAVTPGTPKQAEWVDCVGSGGEIKEQAANKYEISCKFKVVDAEGDHMSVAAVSEGEVVIE